MQNSVKEIMDKLLQNTENCQNVKIPIQMNGVPASVLKDGSHHAQQG
jgi:hypothetical protein